MFDFFSSKNSFKYFVFALSILLGVYILCPYLDYHAFLSPGDHGRDLYCFRVTMQGAMPYQDYWWVYGPLMPFYYAFVLKLLGINVVSVLVGKFFLLLCSGLFIYLTMTLFGPPIIGLLTALWFWTFHSDFFYTYSHTGGITMLTAAVYFLFLYLRNPRLKYLWGGLACLFVLSFIKINMGIFGLGAFLVSIMLIDKACGRPLWAGKKLFYLFSVLIFPLSVFCVYLFFLRGLPIYAIRQCLPYLSTDHPYSTSIWISLQNLYHMTVVNITFNPASWVMALLLWLSAAQGIMFLFNKKIEAAKKNFLLVISVLMIFYAAILHEFLMSGVVFYRVHWTQPVSFMLMFVLIAVGTRDLSKYIRIILYVTLGLIITMEVAQQRELTAFIKTPQQFLNVERGKVFVANSSQWIATVTQTTKFLNEHLHPDEKFFALPYDPLYYFLTDKISPTRQLIFFEHINIPPEQEHIVISDIEKNKVNYILISNRAASAETGLGTFGQTYCPILDDYVKRNFEVIATFGDWEHAPGWVDNHGTKIYKRIVPH